ncbi:MAG: hypothetical protein EOO20_22380 [Chryseobacterium sp.]|nr:MAG: hypothetical protein EOO20_22380 [Chryseobacterium sp.]
MTIVTITKSPTWTEMITGLNVDEEMNAPYEKMRSITSLISGTLKLKYPFMSFTTNKSVIKHKGKNVEVLTIKRVA